jgi:hypothetical protein
LGEGGVEELGENWGRVEESKRRKTLWGSLFSGFPVFIGEKKWNKPKLKQGRGGKWTAVGIKFPIITHS